jgi:hypothetical protein
MVGQAHGAEMFVVSALHFCYTLHNKIEQAKLNTRHEGKPLWSKSIFAKKTSRAY